MIQKRPYPIIPWLVEQPTWGGSYIAAFKGLNSQLEKKIGQSYELSGKSLVPISNSINKSIEHIVSKYPEETLGKKTYETYKKMPLLIKFTQSYGNSFQLHVREKDSSQIWSPKPESWYFFEEGKTTLGLNPKTEIKKYKSICLKIEHYMKKLSTEIQNKTLSLIKAQKNAYEYVKKLNPWQYVNTYQVQKGCVIDLSKGGIHHSWEDDPTSLPHGNIVYEIQTDVDDSSSTLRSFDKGKILNNGLVRPLTIQDYFTYINTSPEDNLLSNMLCKANGERVIKTNHYCLDEIQIDRKRKEYIEDSFVHLFVKEGSVNVSGPDGEITIQRGASCFIPFYTKKYSLSPKTLSATILKTHILY